MVGAARRMGQCTTYIIFHMLLTTPACHILILPGLKISGHYAKMTALMMRR